MASPPITPGNEDLRLRAIFAGEGCLIGVGPILGLGRNEQRRDRMLKLALFFFIVSIIAGLFVVFLILGLVVGSALF
jgi:hypothetical protein